MIGLRLPDIDNPNDMPLLRPGQYVKLVLKNDKVYWLCCSPNDLQGNISNHKIEEHEDGTITVVPSIRITTYNGYSWHGHIEHGVWREVKD